MDIIKLIIGIGLLVTLITFLVYSGVAVRHAARFRYLSKRSVYVSLIYVALASTVMVLAIASYVAYLFS